MLIIVFVVIMCLHPTIDKKLSTRYDKYHNESIDEFDNCDYVYIVNDVKSSDLVVMQLNVRALARRRVN